MSQNVEFSKRSFNWGKKHIGGVLSPHISETARSWRSGVQTQAIDGIAPMKRHIFLGLAGHPNTHENCQKNGIKQSYP